MEPLRSNFLIHAESFGHFHNHPQSVGSDVSLIPTRLGQLGLGKCDRGLLLAAVFGEPPLRLTPTLDGMVDTMSLRVLCHASIASGVPTSIVTSFQLDCHTYSSRSPLSFKTASLARNCTIRVSCSAMLRASTAYSPAACGLSNRWSATLSAVFPLQARRRPDALAANLASTDLRAAAIAADRMKIRKSGTSN